MRLSPLHLDTILLVMQPKTSKSFLKMWYLEPCLLHLILVYFKLSSGPYIYPQWISLCSIWPTDPSFESQALALPIGSKSLSIIFFIAVLIQQYNENPMPGSISSSMQQPWSGWSVTISVILSRTSQSREGKEIFIGHPIGTRYMIGVLCQK